MMRTLTLSALIVSLAATAPAGAQQRLATGAGPAHGVSMAPRPTWNGPRPQTGNWNAPKPGGWNGPRPNQPNWNNTPRPPQQGGWNNTPRPPQQGGWNNTPRPPHQGGWNTPRPNQPGGWTHVPRPGQPGNWHNPRPNPSGYWNGNRPSRWGNKINGHWYAGHNAPGGWNGYHRPIRGWTLPSYWIQPGYYINNYSSYGLSSPPYGYTWSRYYDDAVLLDNRGRVYDSVDGIDWDRYDGGYYDDGGYADGGYGYDQGGYIESGGYERRDNGAGGAVIGGVAGGVAGNLIAGRGNRLAGTLIGAGVGAGAGYVIDKEEDRGRYAAPPRGYGAGYAPPPVVYGRPSEVVQGGGYARDGYAQGGYTSGGYWYPPATTTTVTVNSAPVETVTTTTEYVEETTSYAKARRWTPAPRKKVWKATRAQCRCN